MVTFGHNIGSNNFVSCAQFTLNSLKVLMKTWSGRRGSNPRPSPWQGDLGLLNKLGDFKHLLFQRLISTT